MMKYRWFIPFLFASAFLLRLVFVPNPGFEADMAFWKSWGLAPFDHGLVKGLAMTNNNYPTPFGYILWGVTATYSLFQNPHIFREFWSNTNILFLTLMKLPAIFADLGIGAIILWFSRYVFDKKDMQTGSVLGVVLLSLYLFNPVSIFDGAVWGQVDALGVFLFLLALVLCLKNKPFLAGLFYMVALMTKLQNMIYGPLFFLFVWHIGGVQGLVKALAGSLVAFFGTNIEFVLTKNMGRVVDALTVNYDYFPYMSLNAYNLWWIVAKGAGMHVSDKLLTVGIINAKTLGLLLFSSFYLLATLLLVRKRVVDTTFAFLTGLILVAGAFFLFQTESHDRYAFPIIVFLLLWIPLFLKERITIKERVTFWKTTVFRTSIIGYILFSCLYFLNVHTALIINYPKNGIQWLSWVNQPFCTITLSLTFLLLFCLFLVVNHNTYAKYSTAVSVGFFLFCMLFLNLPLFTKRAIPLTRLTPFHQEQQYGQLTKNMPVNAKQSNYKTWDRLSIQYLFVPQGLGTHAKSSVSYDIKKRFSRFSSDMGIDTEAGPQASVIFKIYGDGVLLFESPVMKRFDYPVHAEVSLVGVTTLTLVVDDAENGNTDDHADWANPMLYP